jgi:uncharacterized protein YbjT (DUF2867 family)
LARCLIIGCGCRGLALAERLRADGYAVRGTSRSDGRAKAIGVAGVEAHVGDPDHVATLAPALEHVTVACILLGSATGSANSLAALHDARLRMLLTRMVDTTVHGIVYESAGSVNQAVLRRGARNVVAACQGSRIPFVLLDADPADRAGWAAAAHDAVGGLLGARLTRNG